MPDDMRSAADLIGHNNPPTDAELLRQRLEQDAADLTGRAQELAAAAGRIPATLDEVTADKVPAFVKQITAAEKALEDRRKSEKSVYDDLGKAVQAFFVPFQDMLKAAKTDANGKLLAFQREQQRKADEERRRIEEEARRQREEADRLAAAAKTEGDLQKAIAIEEEAARTAASAATVTAPTQVRSSYGAVGSIRKTLGFEVVDLAQVPRQFLMLNEAAVKAHLKTGDAAKGRMPEPVPGIRFVVSETMVSR